MASVSSSVPGKASVQVWVGACASSQGAGAGRGQEWEQERAGPREGLLLGRPLVFPAQARQPEAGRREPAAPLQGSPSPGQALPFAHCEQTTCPLARPAAPHPPPPPPSAPPPPHPPPRPPPPPHP